MAALLVSAAWRSSGKTTLCVGLAAAFRARGISVQPFKKGPDFIDPQWLGAAAGRTCRNLDPRLQGAAGVKAYWERHAGGAELALVEGSLGLHDGMALDGSDSNAGLAKLLGLPVVIVLDARGMGRGAAALLAGLAGFDPGVRLAGVILNRVSGARHEGKLRAAIAQFTAVPVLGAIAEDPGLAIVERHLGLVPANEAADPEGRIAALGEAIARQVDLEALLEAARKAPALPPPSASGRPTPRDGPRVGIARDRAFGFYYPDDLEALREAGATLVAIDTLHDAALPPIDGLFLGGGFPEMLAPALAANEGLRREIRAAVEAGLPVYAECGGLMYLSRSLTHLGRRWEMVGAVPADVVMHERPVGKGYVTLAETASHPWGRGEGSVLEAHEFHYSSLENADPGLACAWKVVRGHGIDGRRDGLVYRNVLATYAHQRSVGGNDWAARFVAHLGRIDWAHRPAQGAREPAAMPPTG